jgi:hypothetical protein
MGQREVAPAGGRQLADLGVEQLDLAGDPFERRGWLVYFLPLRSGSFRPGLSLLRNSFATLFGTPVFAPLAVACISRRCALLVGGIAVSL